jgi:hypothetical protein
LVEHDRGDLAAFAGAGAVTEEEAGAIGAAVSDKPSSAALNRPEISRSKASPA